jgi:hypothetical protein
MPDNSNFWFHRGFRARGHGPFHAVDGKIRKQTQAEHKKNGQNHKRNDQPADCNPHLTARGIDWCVFC